MDYNVNESLKKEILDLGGRNYDFINEVGSTIWNFAETARKEYHSAHFLTRRLEEIGYTVTRGVGGFPTGFVGEFKHSEGPVIGLLCEYDALPGLSSTKPGAPGHGCAHNLFSAGALGTALLLKTILEKYSIGGIVRVFGTPSEENLGAKQFYARQGIFDGTDVLFGFHPHADSGAFYKKHNALISKKYQFHGVTAHAGSMPEKGRSALDAAELMNVGVQFLREHVTSDVRIHYTITSGGTAPNIVPDFAENHYVMRAQDIENLKDVERRIDLIASGAAMMTETTVEIDFESQHSNSILNRTLCALATENAFFTGPVPFDDADQKAAEALGFENGIEADITPISDAPGMHGGSSDEADASWVVPWARICLRAFPKATSNHSVIREKQANLPAAYKVMTQTSKVVALTALDLLTDPQKLKDVKQEHREKISGKSAPTDGHNALAIRWFFDVPGINKQDDKTLSVNLSETILLKDYSNVTISVYRAGEDPLLPGEKLGCVLAEDAGKNYIITLSSPATKGDQLVLCYQKGSDTTESLLGYLQHCL